MKCKYCGGSIDECCPKPDVCCECEEEQASFHVLKSYEEAEPK